MKKKPLKQKKSKIIKTNKINSLYIHIPFCNSICPYCDFPKLLKSTPFVEKYLKILLEELASLKINHKLKTIYIGGGTPSAVPLKDLFVTLQKYISDETEFTVEVNPSDIRIDLLKEYKKYRVNRLSLGVQSTDDKILKILGRNHSKKDVFNKIKLVKKYIPNFNIDLIYGFKELTIKKLEDELTDYLKLKPKHISTYSLEIHEGTKFHNEHRAEFSDAKIRNQFDIIYKRLTKARYVRYETSNFALKNYESQHNQVYWRDLEYYGIGLGAASFINHYRIRNTRNMQNYLNKNFICEKEFISKEDDKKYYMMLNLRTINGIKREDYSKRFGRDIYQEKKAIIDSLIVRKLLILNKKYLITTYEGSMLLDIILRELF